MLTEEIVLIGTDPVASERVDTNGMATCEVGFGTVDVIAWGCVIAGDWGFACDWEIACEFGIVDTTGEDGEV